MHIAVRLRRVVARHPWVYWLTCVVLALGVTALVNRQVEALDEQRMEWGTTRRVLVATSDHLPGDGLQTEVRAMPIALVPEAAVDEADGNTIVRQRVSTGEVVVAADLAAPSGPAALADAGTRVVGLSDPLARNVRVGLEVHVVAEGLVLTENARVVDLVDDVIFVAVDAEAAATVAAAAHGATASLVFIP